MRPDRRVEFLSIGAVLLLLGCLYFYLMKPDVTGLLYDDGMYLMAAKALSQGEGYRLIDIVGQPAFYKYPPLFPSLLALVWKLNPNFPDNIVWFKTLNITLSLLTLGLLAAFFRLNRRLPLWISLGLLMAIATNSRWIEVSNELMSEPLFLLWTLLVLLSASRLVYSYKSPPPDKPAQAHKREPFPMETEAVNHRVKPEAALVGLRLLVLLVLLSVAAFYTRSVGLILILSVTVWLIGRAGFKKALLYTTGCLLASLPWLLWSSSHQHPVESLNGFLIRSFQESYFQSLAMDLRYEKGFLDMYSGGVQDLLGSLVVHFLPLMESIFLFPKTPLWAALMIISSFLLVGLMGRQAYTAIKSRQFGLMGLFVAFYLLVLPLWNYHTVYARLFLVVLPFCYVLCIDAMSSLMTGIRLRNSVIALMLGSVILTNLLALKPFLPKPYRNTLAVNAPDINLWQDYAEVIAYIHEHTPQDAVIYDCDGSDAYVYALTTGRRVMDFFVFWPGKGMAQEALENPGFLRTLFVRRADTLMAVLRRSGVSYIISSRYGLVRGVYNNWRLVGKTFPTDTLLLERFPGMLTPVMQSRHDMVMLYRLSVL